MPSPETISTKQRRIAELARNAPDLSFTSLSHHLDLEWMREAYRRTRKNGGVGVDEQTAEEYAVNLEATLQDLLNRVKSGRYQAPSVKRVYIPKGGSKTETRPIGIPTFEDKVLQRAVVMLLEPIYEQDFLDCSYGFRPKRSTHQALETFRNELMRIGGGHVLEIDIRKFFDTVSHQTAQEFLRQRVRDGVIVRLIGKWLNAGVMEDGEVSFPEAGTPQGGVISPLLSNIYLHEVLDKWFESEVRPRLKGEAFLVRYADDAVIGFVNEEDARKVMAVLPKRFGRFVLTLHPEKTRLIPFKRPTPGSGEDGSGDQPGTFDLLGFTHHWGLSRRRKWIIKQRTMDNRLTRGLKAIADWCRGNRHESVREQHKKLKAKVSGQYQYYGITGNMTALERFKNAVERIWFKWLNRRSQKRKHGWEWFKKLKNRYPLPAAKIAHSIYKRRVANP